MIENIRKNITGERCITFSHSANKYILAKLTEEGM
jgi:hypothetical protein